MSRTKKIFSHQLREAAAAGQPRPLALDNGLVAGLRAECQRFDGRLSGRPRVAGRLDGLPAAVDVAVRRIVAEALANAARFARATECWGTVDRTAELALRIPDGHVGTGETPRHGGGLGSTPERIARFSDIVFESGISAPVRTPRGRDIDAACGQLKTAAEKKRRSREAA